MAPRLSRHERYLPYLYAAYGMNTSVAGMMGRCPMARAVGTCVLPGHRLAFRGVADVVRDRAASIALGIWQITAECERALDRLEGFRSDGSGLYFKRQIQISGRGPLAGHQAMIYLMTRREGFAEPSEGYEFMLRQGYTDFGLPHRQIDEAVAHARKWQPAEPRFRSLWRYSSDERFAESEPE